MLIVGDRGSDARIPHAACPARQPCRRRPVALFFRVLRTTSTLAPGRDSRWRRHCSRTRPGAGGVARIDLFAGPIVGQIPASAGIFPSSPMTLIQLRRRACRRQAQRARPSFRAWRRVPRIIYGTGSIARGFNAIQCIEISNNGKTGCRNVQG
ncbi:hypothetical protein A8E25_00515 [Burkholderia cenocepacia]|nr:hypothetical protein BURCENK562V_C3420 [Burkholderia cenocepacia K56-2Valvano]ERI26705.1 hypothetical protein BURCENBC7_AP2875 [Burkholderia cenocepacia BC7]ONR65410.1 hypothetical protein A8E17_05315 [Burkholderia cenocepacia]ONR73981.1 hypothetical protein A8E23_10250 [Burkholderia cenocepacia]ONR75075.1 hypothetical protein A8E18_09885 [Burkholderia cenocepacia]